MKITSNEKTGFTLIELIIAIAIVGILVITFIPLFTFSAKTNYFSDDALDSTYLGKDIMELIYDLSKTVPYDELKNKLVNEYGYQEISSNTYSYEFDNEKYLTVSFTENGSLIKVIVKIYKDINMDQLEVQYESLYSWIGRGVLNEE